MLASDRYSLQPSFSDFSGNDPVYYDYDAKKLIAEIRVFFHSVLTDDLKANFVSKQQILADYERFRTQLYMKYGGVEEEIQSLSDDEYCDEVKQYLA